jgi:hypothetical protein
MGDFPMRFLIPRQPTPLQVAFFMVAFLGMEASGFYLPGVNPQSFAEGDV